MKFFRGGQISAVEMIFVVLLVLSFLSYFYIVYDEVEKDYSSTIESMLDAVYYSDDYREMVMDEDLSVLAVSADWSSLKTLLDDSVGEYEVYVRNMTVKKTIYSCERTSNRYYSERVVGIKDNDLFEFRVVGMGVCY